MSNQRADVESELSKSNRLQLPGNLNKPTNVRWQIFIALLGLTTINYIDRAVLSVAMPAIQEDLSLDPAIVGLLLSSFFWGYALMQIPIGWIADRYRPDKLIVGSAFAWGIAQTLTGFVSTSKMLVLLRVILGIAESPIFPSGAKLQSVWLTSKERGRGATLLDSGASLGTALGGPVTVAFMAWLGGWRGALIGVGILTIVIAFISWRVIKGTPETNPRVNEAEREYLRKAHLEEYKNDSNQKDAKAARMKHYLKSRNFWAMCIGFYSLNTIFFGLMTWGPNYLAKTQNLDITTVGGAILLIFGTGVIGELTGGWIADTWRKKGGKFNTVMHTLLVASGLISAACILLLTLSTSPAMAVTLLCIALFFLRWAGLYWSIPAAISQRDHIGTVGGSMNFAGNMAGVITPIVIGFIVSSTGSYFLGLLLFSVFGLVLAGASLLIDFTKKIEAV
ncbi:MFS transporter [Peribacillus cavernae]|uniref:MFS transporter n=1 Tax=Peribacillus cavernae TaxID=1674310 RepID=A0A3S0TZE9_9BACI|nr:MFS transporter [Peribacillus cavernae]MDQ0218686.1 ACS family D-galactonate transporter-like MFS transporter [Peribacillus cavernae]RUQ30907.1 MFS transporter [Peribacillus cavernae]